MDVKTTVALPGMSFYPSHFLVLYNTIAPYLVLVQLKKGGVRLGKGGGVFRGYAVRLVGFLIFSGVEVYTSLTKSSQAVFSVVL